jgi:hypothetical protein
LRCGWSVLQFILQLRLQFSPTHPHTQQVDIYALGVILNEAWTRRQPWAGLHHFQVIVRVAVEGNRPPMEEGMPEGLRRLVTRCWHQDPRARPSALEVMRLAEVLAAESAAPWG